MSEVEFAASSPDDTAALGLALGHILQAGDLVALVGDLGAGKTLLVQSLARGLGVPAEVPVVSPTFTLINEYDGGRARLYHADLYRIEREIELDELGLDDMCRRGDGAVVVEWADRFDVLGRDCLTIRIEVTGEASRALRASTGGARSAEVLQAWQDELANRSSG